MTALWQHWDLVLDVLDVAHRLEMVYKLYITVFHFLKKTMNFRKMSMKKFTCIDHSLYAQGVI